MARKSNTLNDLSQTLMEGDYLMSVGTHGARVGMGEKRIILGALHSKT
jgi:hypothetical protein